MKKKQTIFFILDILILLLSFLFAAYFKPATIRFYIPTYIGKVLIFIVIWVIISLIGNKYKIPNEKKFSNIISALFRNDFVILGLLSFVLFITKKYEYSRLIVFGTIFVAFFLEFVLSLIFYFHTKIKKKYDFSEEIDYKPTNLISPDIPSEKKIDFSQYSILDDEKLSSYDILKNKYLKEFPKIFNWLKNKVPLKAIDKNSTFSINTSTLYNISNIEDLSQKLFINLHLVNDFQRINGYFIEVNKKLLQNGIFVGRAITNKEVYNNFLKKYKSFLGNFFYIFYFIIHRAIPKLKGFKEIYFAITKGENRALSKAEILGRIYFCGFQVYDVTEIDGILHFIAIKISEPKEDKNPSYGPLIKLKRIGIDKKIIYIYKFRTMHPYSEYLQSYIYEHNKLEKGGKFKNDFRITTWGKIYRKFWIDELPQIINLLKGDVSIFGVRALSVHYFNLYPKELQELRTKFKPGLIPPYYVDLPNSFDEIIKSEKKYLLNKQKHPFKTDFVYFFKAIYNILIKHAHSK